MHKLRIGVLMGGKSEEREVSLNSGRTVCDHIDSARYEIIPLFQHRSGTLYILPWHFLYRGKISDFEHRLAHQATAITWDMLKKQVDFIFIAQHGRYAEDGILQGTLEVLGIPYFGSKVFASALGMDKLAQKTFLRQAGIRVPRDIVITPAEFSSLSYDDILQKMATAQLTFPVVVKPMSEGSSLGVTMVIQPDNLLRAVAAAMHVNQRPQKVLVEEKINGMEFSCIVVTDYTTGTLMPLIPTEIVPEHAVFDYEQKYMPGRSTKFTPARGEQAVLNRIQDAACSVMKVLNFKNLGRIDGFMTPSGEIVITDPNSFSGMSPSCFMFLQAAHHNMSTTAIINHLIETELHAYGMLDTLPLTSNERGDLSMQAPNKLRVAVIMGGDSNEKEISLESGRNIFYKLSPQEYEAIPLFVNKDFELYRLDQKLLVRNSTKEIEQTLTSAQHVEWDLLPTIADFVFIGLHGGKGENGSLQGMLEMLGIPYNGSSVLTSALCMDKYKTTQFLRAHGFEVPRSMLLSNDEFKNADLQQFLQRAELTFPLIVKPHDDGCSVLVHKVATVEQLQDALATLFAAGKTMALIEEYINGMELTVGVLGNDQPLVLPPSQAVAAAGILSIEEKFLPGAGENQTPAPLPTETLAFVQTIIGNAYKTLNCRGYARIDCFYQTATQSPTGTERVVLLEVNTLPGLTPATCIFHQAAEIGIKPMEFIGKIIKLGMSEHTIPLENSHKRTRDHEALS